MLGWLVGGREVGLCGRLAGICMSVGVGVFLYAYDRSCSLMTFKGLRIQVAWLDDSVHIKWEGVT